MENFLSQSHKPDLDSEEFKHFRQRTADLLKDAEAIIRRSEEILSGHAHRRAELQGRDRFPSR